MYDGYVIGISEIWTKSEKVRQLLIKKLIWNIKQRIPDARFEVRRGRIILRPFREEYTPILLKTFGIRYFSPAYFISTNEEEINEKCKMIAKNIHTKTFKVEVKRVWKGYSKVSLEIERELGSIILSENPNLKVDVKSPMTTVNVEIHRDITLIFHERIEGYDGYPVDTQGKALGLFSGGIDSPVAAWLIAKRGVGLDLLLLNLAGEFHRAAVCKVYNKLLDWIPNAKFYEVNGMPLIESIIWSVRTGYRQIVFKVYLYRIAEAIAEKLGVSPIVTGESIGQVSTQTLDSLLLLDNLSKKSFLRPLLAYNKEEIKKLAELIGTLNLSEKVPEVCMLEKHATANPKIEIVEHEVEKINFNLDAILETLEEVDCSKSINFADFIPHNVKPAALTIIDVTKVKDVPEAQNRKYLFVCKTGTTAYAYAKRFRDKGVEAYALDYKTAQRMGFLER